MYLSIHDKLLIFCREHAKRGLPKHSCRKKNHYNMGNWLEQLDSAFVQWVFALMWAITNCWTVWAFLNFVSRWNINICIFFVGANLISTSRKSAKLSAGKLHSCLSAMYLVALLLFICIHMFSLTVRYVEVDVIDWYITGQINRKCFTWNLKTKCINSWIMKCSFKIYLNTYALASLWIKNVWFQ